VPFHVELKDQREIVRAFNLTEEQVRTQFVEPLRAGRMFMIEDKEFEPRKAQLIVIEGKNKLGIGELGLGQGWTNAVKRGEDVTKQFLSATGAQQPATLTLELSGRLKERIRGRLAAGPLALGDGLGLTGDLLKGHRVSERLSTVEIAVWEMLHGGELTLHANAGAEPLAKDQWEAVVLDPATWLAPGPDSPVISAIA
jgi:hypothetical protein